MRLAAYERRYKARLLLFGKGRGQSKNLAPKEQKFVASVWRESYQAYVIEFQTGKSRPFYSPASFRYRRVTRKAGLLGKSAHRRRWYGSQKKRWIYHDMPNLMSQRFDADQGNG